MKTVKKLIYMSAFAVMSAVSFSSCEDFLTAENKSAGQSADEYFSTDAGLAALRVTAYSYLKNVTSPNDGGGERELTQMYADGTDLYTPCRNKTPSQLHQYALSSNEPLVKSFYVFCYALINNANGVLQNGGENSAYAPEMHFLRAYGYYLLTQQFGAVPYVTNYVEDANLNYPRTDLKTIYDSEIAALAAIANDSRLPAEDHTGKVSQRAVKALLAKLNLAAGWDLETELGDAERGTYSVVATNYFSEAARWADEAIAGQGLTMAFEDKWSPFNEGNAEEIFSVQYERAGYPGDVTSGGHGLQNDFSAYDGVILDTGGKYCASKHAATLKSLYLWEEGDTRYESTFMMTRYNYKKDSEWGQEGYYAWYNVGKPNETTLPIAFQYFPWYYENRRADVEAWITQNAARLSQDGGYTQVPLVRIMGDPVQIYNALTGTWTETPYTTYINSVGEGNSNLATPSVKKWDDPETNSDNDENGGYRDVVILHLSEIYLVAAEAYYMAGNEATSLDRLNAVRTRAGLAALSSYSAYTPSYTTPSSFGWNGALDVILDERARELYAENYRWMDLRRTKQLVRYNIAFNSYVTSVDAMKGNGEIKWYRPIPQDEINTNTALMNDPNAQNPGY